jgi:uncharacterized membrane protein (DUF441 family)
MLKIVYLIIISSIMKIGVKLTVTFFTIAFLSVIVIGYISYNKGKKSLEQESFNRLTAVREMKATQIEDYFQLIQDQASSFFARSNSN